MNLIQAFLEMLLGQGQDHPPGPALQMRPAIPPGSQQATTRPGMPVTSPGPQPSPTSRRPIVGKDPTTGKRTVQHFVPVPQVPAQQQLPAMQRQVATRNPETGEITYGPLENVPLTPISPQKF